MPSGITRPLRKVAAMCWEVSLVLKMVVAMRKRERGRYQVRPIVDKGAPLLGFHPYHAALALTAS